VEKALILWRNLLDFCLPRTSDLKKLEEMSAVEFCQSARKLSRADCSNLPINIRPFFSYRDPLVRTAIWQIKYRNHSKISRLLAEVIYSGLLEELMDRAVFEDFQKPLLIPIPLSAERLRSRGYNQTENLAQELTRIDGGQNFELLTNVLTKIKETKPQSSLPRTLRLQNLKGCLHVTTPERIRHRNIILLDDVTTTGATFTEAQKTLEKVEARNIIAISVAH